MFSLKNKLWDKWDSKNTNYFEGERTYTYEIVKEYFYSIISQIHIKFSQRFLEAGISISPHFPEKEEVGFRKAHPD